MGTADDLPGERPLLSGSMRMVSLIGRRRSSVTPALVTLLACAAVATGCGGSSDDTAGASPSAAAGSTQPTLRPSGSLPPEAAAKQGGKYYAVFLAVAADANDKALADAQERAKELGYQGGVGDVNCTPGARTALDLQDTGDYTAYSIFFDTNQQAQAFLNAYSGPVVGTAYVTAGCLD